MNLMIPLLFVVRLCPRKDLEIQESINQSKEDECRVYMFNVDLSSKGSQFYQQLSNEYFASLNTIIFVVAIVHTD